MEVNAWVFAALRPTRMSDVVFVGVVVPQVVVKATVRRGVLPSVVPDVPLAKRVSTEPGFLGDRKQRGVLGTLA